VSRRAGRTKKKKKKKKKKKRHVLGSPAAGNDAGRRLPNNFPP